MNALGVFAALQGVFLGPLLATSALGKVRMRRRGFEQTAFLRLLWRLHPTAGADRQWATWMALATVEGLLAILLTLGLEPVVLGSIAATFFLSAAWYLAWAVRYEGGSSCGCFSARFPATWTSVARALCLSTAAAGYAVDGQSVWSASRPAVSVGLLSAAFTAELTLLLLLSPDLTAYARLLAKAARRVADERRVSIEAFRFAISRARVEASEFWSQYIVPAGGGAALVVRDRWVSGAWRYHEYAGIWFGEPLTIVTAVRMADPLATWRLVASVESGATEGRIVAACDSEAEKERAKRQKRQQEVTLTARSSEVAAAS